MNIKELKTISEAKTAILSGKKLYVEAADYSELDDVNSKLADINSALHAIADKTDDIELHDIALHMTHHITDAINAQYESEHSGNSTEFHEDTVKRAGKWVNVGKSGKSHGTFKTRKSADAQRKAMFANGYKG